MLVIRLDMDPIHDQ